MKRPLRLFSTILLGSTVIWLGATSSGQACFFGLFKHHHRHHMAFPAPAATFYAPPINPCCPPPVAFRPVCPTPCPPVACPGVCDIGLAPPGMQPLPEQFGPRPRTFVDDPPDRPVPQYQEDDGFRSRGGFDGDPEPESFDRDQTRRGTLRPDTVIPRRESPPSRQAEPASETELRLPAWNLAERITWREPAEPTRLIVPARYSTPAVARSRLNPNDGWLPASDDARLARK